MASLNVGNVVVKLTSNGEVNWQIGGGDLNDGRFDWPHSLATDLAGNVYVADRRNHRIQKIDSNGNHLVTFGNLRSGPGEFNQPFGIAVDNVGNIYVADQQNHRVQKLVLRQPNCYQDRDGGV